MTIKSILIGSAAALVAFSANAADAIVAAEPEALEYVRVCDAFGTGYFFIPGSETCLKIGGSVRFQVDVGRDVNDPSDWNAFTRAVLTFDARTETELGALRSHIQFRGIAENGNATDSTTFVEEAYIELAGLTVGKFYSWWDNDLSGEGDTLASNSLFNSIRYTYDAGAFSAGISVDELEGIQQTPAVNADNNVGIAASLGFAISGVTLDVIGGYDVDHKEGAIRAILSGDVGPGTLGIAAAYATGWNAYYNAAEWVIAAEYGIAATDKLTITPLVQYENNVDLVNGVDQWSYSVTFDYAVTTDLSAKVAVIHADHDVDGNNTSGLVRLERSF